MSLTDEYGPRIKLPDRIGLCPIHGEQFYMPLGDDEKVPRCPECPERLVIYRRRKSRVGETQR